MTHSPCDRMKTKSGTFHKQNKTKLAQQFLPVSSDSTQIEREPKKDQAIDTKRFYW